MKLVWYSEIKWDYLKTRKQHLLSHFPQTDKILFFQPFSFNGPNPFFPKKVGNVTYVTLPVYRKSASPFLNSLFNHNFIRAFFYSLVRVWGGILQLIILHGAPDQYIFSNIFSLPLKRKKCKSLWEYNDDPEQFGAQPTWAMDLFEQYLRNPEHRVTACSRHITHQLEAKYQRKVHHIPNGVDLGDFTNSDNPNSLDEGNILGYVGVISSWFFDFELIGKISKAYPDYEIKLIGPVHRDATDDLKTLLLLPNVSHLDAIPYSQVPATMKTFRVGLIPLKSIPQVWQAASAKFLQYLSSGIPVVSTYMEQFAGLSQQAFLCKTHDETISGISEALKIDRVEISGELERYDWQNLSHTFQQILWEHSQVTHS